jgi:hypothetical protein
MKKSPCPTCPTSGLGNCDITSVASSLSHSAFPSPSLFLDTDGDGDDDLLVGEADGLIHYFENVGNSAVPEYTPRESLPDGL